MDMMARYNVLLPSMTLSRKDHPFTRDNEYKSNGGIKHDARNESDKCDVNCTTTSRSKSTVIWINTLINIKATPPCNANNESNVDGAGAVTPPSSSSMSTCAMFKFRLSLPTTPLLTQPAAPPTAQTATQAKQLAHQPQAPEAPSMTRGNPEQLRQQQQPRRKRRLYQQAFPRSVRFQDAVDANHDLVCDECRDDNCDGDEDESSTSLSSLYITDDEIEATWYQKSDYQRFKQDYNETKRLLQNLLPLDHNTQTAVGLEYYDTSSINAAANSTTIANTVHNNNNCNVDTVSQQQRQLPEPQPQPQLQPQKATTLRQRKSQRRRFVIQTILAEQDILRRISRMYNDYECYGSITLYDVYYRRDEMKTDKDSIAKLYKELAIESVQDALRIGLEIRKQLQQEEQPQPQGNEIHNDIQDDDTLHGIDI